MIFEDKILLGMKFRQIKHTNNKLAKGWIGEKTSNACAWQNDEFSTKWCVNSRRSTRYATIFLMQSWVEIMMYKSTSHQISCNYNSFSLYQTITPWSNQCIYMTSFIAKRVNSILVKLRYLRFKLLKYKEIKKIIRKFVILLIITSKIFLYIL